MARFDIPAVLDKITSVTAQPKVTYVGYADASLQMLYGLTQQEETYYANKLEKCILLAPCLYGTTTGYDDYKTIF